MPIATKRRKLAATPKNTLTGGIGTFVRVSKATTTAKAIIEKNHYVDTIRITTVEESANQRKRKSVEETEEDAPITTDRKEIKLLPQRRSHELQRSPKTPQNLIKNGLSPASLETPTKGARSLLDRLSFASTTPTRSPLFDTSFSSNLDASTPQKKPQEFPIELLDLINLHAAFLTALSIHYAHNGTHSPADLRVLCPDVARAWGKRRVLLEDIRRTLGVLNSNIMEWNKNHRIMRLSLSNYGHGKICVEIKVGAGKAGRMARPINEDALNRIFVQVLKTLWEDRESDAVQEFISELPLEPITTCPSLMKMSPLLAKGQRRLEELRVGIIAKKEAEKEKVEEKSNRPKPTLLERLRAKQLHQSTLPPPPSKAEIARKAALGRIDEVVAVLSLLSTSSSVGQSRISFTFPTVLGKLRDSFKTPMSKEEGDTCVRLLASDIAPEWVKIVKMGKVEALVVNRDERPREEDIRERVKRAA